MADYQMSALAMAICIRGMTVDETVTLTQQMLTSGHTLQWRNDQPIVDKHSTGGLGDKISIVLAPLLASVGLGVPMISGRGLGITGGTLDKLESIPGYQTQLSTTEIQRQVETVGCVICGASADLAPADRRLYSLRDVTATVESVPLITASILSKKLAESLSSLILDVKFGSGAFMSTAAEAQVLAESLVRVGNQLGVRTQALLTDMNQPLGRMVGNTVEIHESIEVLQGAGPADVRELTLALGAELLLSEGMAKEIDEARQTLTDAIASGAAYERFERMVDAQGGRLPSVDIAQWTTLVTAQADGVLAEIDGRKIGTLLIELGGGRRLATDEIDPAVGLELFVRIGDDVTMGQPLCKLFSSTKIGDTQTDRVRSAFIVGDESVAPPPLIVGKVKT